MKQKHPKNSGFTLIELLVVISIIGLLASVVLAALQAARGKANIAAGLTFSDTAKNTLYSNALIYYDFNSDPLGTPSTFSNSGSDNITPSPFTGMTVVADTSLHNSGNNLAVTNTALGVRDDNNVYLQPCSSYTAISPICAALVSATFTFTGWYRNSGTNLSATCATGYCLLFGSVNGQWTNLSVTSDSSGNVNEIHVSVDGASGQPDVVMDDKINVPNGTWGQYAYSVYNTGSNLLVKLYVMGRLIDTQTVAYNANYPANGEQNALLIAGVCCTWVAPGLYDDIGFYSAPLATSYIEKMYAFGALKHGIALADISI